LLEQTISHYGIVVSHLDLGRAWALQGDTAKAPTAYQDFFSLRKEADPDIPLLKTARTESEKLK
jgi:eukaryotic-like serine/threonine-protein kinase